MAVPVTYDVLAVRKLHGEVHAGIHKKSIWLPLSIGAEFVSSLELGVIVDLMVSCPGCFGEVHRGACSITLKLLLWGPGGVIPSNSNGN